MAPGSPDTLEPTMATVHLPWRVPATHVHAGLLQPVVGQLYDLSTLDMEALTTMNTPNDDGLVEFSIVCSYFEDFWQAVGDMTKENQERVWGLKHTDEGVMSIVDDMKPKNTIAGVRTTGAHAISYMRRRHSQALHTLWGILTNDSLCFDFVYKGGDFKRVCRAMGCMNSMASLMNSRYFLRVNCDVSAYDRAIQDRKCIPGGFHGPFVPRHHTRHPQSPS